MLLVLGKSLVRAGSHGEKERKMGKGHTLRKVWRLCWEGNFISWNQCFLNLPDHQNLFRCLLTIIDSQVPPNIHWKGLAICVFNKTLKCLLNKKILPPCQGNRAITSLQLCFRKKAMKEKGGYSVAGQQAAAIIQNSSSHNTSLWICITWGSCQTPGSDSVGLRQGMRHF